ncbi:hypothetical protein MTP99_016260 [Tenebrio molitor]|nr:hypothetical protein MTP99_016260 [Tenebrio molitor]
MSWGLPTPGRVARCISAKSESKMRSRVGEALRGASRLCHRVRGDAVGSSSRLSSSRKKGPRRSSGVTVDAPATPRTIGTRILGCCASNIRKFESTNSPVCAKYFCNAAYFLRRGSCHIAATLGRP